VERSLKKILKETNIENGWAVSTLRSGDIFSKHHKVGLSPKYFPTCKQFCNLGTNLPQNTIHHRIVIPDLIGNPASLCHSGESRNPVF
jgi:hypothetical protein